MTNSTLIVSSVVSVVVSLISGWIAAKIAYSKEIKTAIYEKRQSLYIEIFELLETLERNPNILFNYELFIHPMQQVSAKTYLYSSADVLCIIKPFFNKVIEVWNRYVSLFASEAAEKELQNRIILAIDSGELSAEQVELEFEQEAVLFKEKNKIPSKEVYAVLERLSVQIRQELKTKQ